MRLSIRELVLAVALVALGLGFAVREWRHAEAIDDLKAEAGGWQDAAEEAERRAREAERLRLEAEETVPGIRAGLRRGRLDRA